MRLGWGVLTLRVLDALEHYGPMTQADLTAHLGLKRPPGGSLFQRLLKARPKRIHIKGWPREHDGARRYPRALYAFGPGRDAPRPPPLPRTELARKRAQEAQAAMSSVVPGITQRDASRMRARITTLQRSA